MDFIAELRNGWFTPEEFARVAVRLGTALIVGAVAGIDRERLGKAAGLRTHMLVALGAATFALTAELAGLTGSGLATVIQGVAVGVGFLGGGAILKSTDDKEIHGLTTAAGIWMTAAAGITAGLGHTGLALLATGLAWIILAGVSMAARAAGAPGSNRA